ncbi:uncharacterized protein OCT59_014863 [Rhizophagus irregularis]|uniref:uncharacterized protein n=1 Tax=Rhizophagus irregularis TaxID=588596 RepID=UPI003325E3CF|nr:hypothetical protein OCT59_014863 [Rhizophagus irregularis]
MQNVDMSKKNFFSFAIKFKEFTLEEVTIPAHILGHLYYNKTFSNLCKHHSEAIVFNIKMSDEINYRLPIILYR